VTNCQHPDCELNPQPARVGYLCGLHFRGLEADIADIARAVTSLADPDLREAMLAPRGGDGGGSGIPGSRPPMRLAVILSPATIAAVQGWAEVLLQSDDVDLRRAVDALAVRAEHIACHAEVAVIAPELREAAQDCRAAFPDDRWNTAEQDDRPREVKRCDQPDPRDEAQPCRGRMFWRPGTLSIVCERCRHAEHMVDGFATVGQVAAAFGVPRSTLNTWIRRGKVEAIDGKVYISDVRRVVLDKRDQVKHHVC